MFALAGLLAGCEEKPAVAPAGPQVLRVAVSETLVPAAERQAWYFAQRTPGLTSDVLPRTARGALVALLADSVYAVLIDRPLNEEERQALAARDVEPLVIHVGTGALALVVHPSNPLDSLARGSVPRLLRRRGGWGETVPGGLTQAVELVSTGRNSGLYEIAATRFAPGAGDLALAHVAPSQDSVLAYVARRPGALGLVSLEALRDTVLARRVKVLAVRDSGAAMRPNQMNVYLRKYPLRYEAYYVTTRPQRSVEARFATFIMSDVGQRAVQRVGLVPAKIPAYRFIVTQ